MLPILGHLSTDLMNAFSAYFWYWSPAFMAVYDSVLSGFCGSGLGFSVVAASFMSYASCKKERTIRIGILFFFVNLGLSVGYLAGGYATEYLGYIKGFSLCVGLYVLSIIAGK